MVEKNINNMYINEDIFSGFVENKSKDESNLDNNLEPVLILTSIQYNLINTLRLKGSLTRRDLVRILDIPRTTIYDNLLKLQKLNIVEKFSVNNGKPGRPLIYWKILPSVKRG